MAFKKWRGFAFNPMINRDCDFSGTFKIFPAFFPWSYCQNYLIFVTNDYSGRIPKVTMNR